MTEPGPRRVRAKKPKARTGCRTCKARRVKCDEGRPFCARCVKFGVACEGYEVKGQFKASPQPRQLKEILPQTGPGQGFVLPSLGSFPFNAVFQDNREYSYFLFFQEEAKVGMASHFDEGLFNQVIIQTCWNEPSLCQLGASLGALYKTASPSASKLPKEQADLHRQYAFQKYGRALKCVETRISSNRYQESTRVALIASLLIYGFENLYGDLPLALKHLESALQLMKTQLLRAAREYKHSNNSSPTSDLDDDLVAAFFRLDSGLSARDDICDAETIGSRLGVNYLDNTFEIPERFISISEARNYLESIQFPVTPSLARDLAMAGLSESNSSATIDQNTRDMYTTMSSQLHQWHMSFDRLCVRSDNLNGKHSVAAATLRVRAISTEIASERVCAMIPESSEFLSSKSRELVDLSIFVANDPNFLKSFVWDCGIVPGLSIVIAASLDMSTRMEALGILKSIVPRREGVWDSVTAVAFGERCLGVSKDSCMDY